jgi:predicted small integral membrane protein
MLRFTKVALVVAAALIFSLIIFDSLTNFDSNYLFFSHDLVKDVGLPGGQGMWSAMDLQLGHNAVTIGIFLWQFLTLALCWWGALRLANALGRSPGEFQRAKGIAKVGLTLGLLMWLVAIVGTQNEWSAMWRLRSWSGHGGTFAMFVLFAIALMLLAQTEAPRRA